MSDDKMFDYILARSRTRESSILTIAAIASSASLVLLGLFIQAHLEAACCCLTNDDSSKKCANECGNKCELFHVYNMPIQFIGIAFAVTGIAYRELTKYTIHNKDENWLRDYAKKCWNKDEDDLKRNILVILSETKNLRTESRKS